MLIKLLIISVVIIIPALALLGVRILLKENGEFPETHTGRNKEMNKRGISCAQHTDIGCNPVSGLSDCVSCGERNLQTMNSHQGEYGADYFKESDIR